MDLLRFMAGMRSALYQAGQVARGLQGHVPAEAKAPDSRHQQSTAVTLADRLSQEVLLLRAYDLAPELEVHSEEMDACPIEIADLFARNHHRYALILDPIDGTDDYLAGRPTYGQMLGLLDQESGRMACGMVHFPATQRTLMAAQGIGVFFSQGLWGALHSLRWADPPRSVVDTKRLLEADYAWFRDAKVEVVPNASRSSACELARVCQGTVGAAAMRHFHGYDTAIVGALVEALGGAVLDGSGSSVVYEKAMPRLPLVVLSLDQDFAREIALALGRHSD